MIPTLAFFVAGYVHKSGFTIGYPRSYAASRAIGAMVNLEMATFGLPPNSLWLFGFALFVLPPLLLVAIAKAALPERRIPYFAFFTVIPAAVLILRPPNTHAARYFFAASPFLLLLAAESFSQLWKPGGWRRATALAALAASLTGDGLAIAQTLAGEPGALDRRAHHDPPIAPADARHQLRLQHRQERRLFQPRTRCGTRSRPGGAALRTTARVVHRPNGRRRAPDPTIDLAGKGCRLTYILRGKYNPVPSQLPGRCIACRTQQRAAGNDSGNRSNAA